MVCRILEALLFRPETASATSQDLVVPAVFPVPAAVRVPEYLPFDQIERKAELHHQAVQPVHESAAAKSSIMIEAMRRASRPARNFALQRPRVGALEPPTLVEALDCTREAEGRLSMPRARRIASRAGPRSKERAGIGGATLERVCLELWVRLEQPLVKCDNRCFYRPFEQPSVGLRTMCFRLDASNGCMGTTC